MSRPPDGVLRAVERALEEAGQPHVVRSVRPVPGGSINRAHRVETDGDAWFLKWNPASPPGMFAAEAGGLEALRGAGALRVPRALGWEDARGGTPGWLLLEHVARGTPGPRFQRTLGEGLAALHRSADPDAGWGAAGDNWIGSLPQANGPAPSWSAFWRDRRIVPQLEAARGAGRLAGAGDLLDRLVDAVPAALADVEDAPPALLHGDLWSGNCLADESGEPVLVDPASYRGHGEVDLAMAELFGGFGAAMFRAYGERIPVGPGYASHRRSLYQLYYLLVHVNLFGAGYEAPTLAAARSVLAAV